MACERADQVEKEVVRLTKKYGCLAREKEEWMEEARNLAGENKNGRGRRKKKKIAREALRQIVEEIHQLAARTSELNRERSHYRAEEIRAEDGQGELGDAIERLRDQLEEILAKGGE